MNVGSILPHTGNLQESTTTRNNKNKIFERKIFSYPSVLTYVLVEK